MSWENHGIYWHLDHIIPCSAFDLTKKQNNLFVLITGIFNL